MQLFSKTMLAVLTTYFALGASAASASMIIATYKGTVNGGYDTTGVFGSIGNLAGDPYTATYIFDTSKGAVVNNLPGYEEVEGGSFYGVSSPISATFTLNDITISLENSTQNLAFYKSAYDTLEYLTEGGYDFLYSNAFGVPVDNIYTPFSQIDTIVQGTLSINGRNPTTGASEIVYADLSYGGAEQGSVEVSVASVPEPESWCLLVMGVGLTGALLRSGQTRRPRRTCA